MVRAVDVRGGTGSRQVGNMQKAGLSEWTRQHLHGLSQARFCVLAHCSSVRRRGHTTLFLGCTHSDTRSPKRVNVQITAPRAIQNKFRGVNVSLLFPPTSSHAVLIARCAIRNVIASGISIAKESMSVIGEPISFMDILSKPLDINTRTTSPVARFLCDHRNVIPFFSSFSLMRRKRACVKNMKNIPRRTGSTFSWFAALWAFQFLYDQ